MKKKNLLFVIPSLIAGGGQKSLINLLTQIDYRLFNVDLYLFSKNGLFINSIPKDVHILELPNKNIIFSDGLKKSLLNFLRNRQFHLAYSRLMFSIKNRVIRNTANSEQYTWKYQSESFEILEKNYDVAVAYLEKSPIYFVVDKVKSKKKIGWIHTNYKDSGMDYHFDFPYFKQLDHLVTVSEECANSLKENFSDFSNKVKVIYNIVSPHLINNLSNKDTKDIFEEDYDAIKIVTIARLSHEKGIDLAIKACKLLVNKGYKICWYVVGDGGGRESLEHLIQSNDLKVNFKLIGIKENPYPYIRKADIYVQPSRYEGKSIAIDEAKILHKPIVVTNFDSAKDQIKHEVNGLIVDKNEIGICDGIEKLIVDVNFRNLLVNHLSEEKLGTEEEIQKLYKLFRR